MTIWTPKEAVGIKSQWAPEKKGRWDESNILVYSTELRQERIIHLENVYRYMWHYFSEEGWKSSDSIGSVEDNKRYENFYGEYRDQDGHKEIRFWWRMQKECAGIAGSHPYFQYKVYVDVLTTHMKRIEIMYKGQKIKPYVGEFILWFNSILILDRNKWFTKDGPLSVFADFFPRMMYKDRIREQEIELRRFSERFVEDLKFFIGLNRFNAVRQAMEPEKQWL
ncbi:MAG: hypothetical protein QXR96_00825 [Candidatus Woesearchaeota archaeon]